MPFQDGEENEKAQRWGRGWGGGGGKPPWEEAQQPWLGKATSTSLGEPRMERVGAEGQIPLGRPLDQDSESLGPGEQSPVVASPSRTSTVAGLEDHWCG